MPEQTEAEQQRMPDAELAFYVDFLEADNPCLATREVLKELARARAAEAELKAAVADYAGGILRNPDLPGSYLCRWLDGPRKVWYWDGKVWSRPGHHDRLEVFVCWRIGGNIYHEDLSSPTRPGDYRD